MIGFDPNRTTLHRITLAFFALAILLAAGAVQAQTQTSTTATGTANAEIVSNPLALTEVVQLDFGVLLPTTSNGFVTVDSSGSISADEVHVRTQGNPATWEIAGEPGARVSIDLPANDQVSLIDSVSGDTMPVNNFERNVSTTPTLNTDGNLSFQVGATLTVRSDQNVGVYSGSYDVTVSYE